MEPNPNRNDYTQENHFKIPDYSYSEIFTGPVQNPVVELQQKVSEFFSSDKIQAEIERLRLQHQRRSEATNQILR